MLRAIRLLVLPMIAAGALTAISAEEAQAQIRVQIGGFGLNGGGVYRGGHYFRSNQRVYSSYRPLYSHGHSYHLPQRSYYGGHHGIHHGGHGYWHDTTHYDYHPPQIYRHGNHWDIQPGHYHLHRSGHFHHY